MQFFQFNSVKMISQELQLFLAVQFSRKLFFHFKKIEKKFTFTGNKRPFMQTIIIFILSVLGIVCLASAGILGTVFLGPAAFGVAAGSATACAFLGTFAKASSSKFSKTDQNEAERTANHEEFEK